MNLHYKMTLAHKQKHLGFTIIEMIITVALLAVMLGVAVPGFSSLFANNKLTEVSNRFLSSMIFARSEAINRNDSVSMCLLNDAGNGCDNDGRWEDGWMIWVDTNSSNTFNVGEEIAVEAPLPNNYTLRADNNNFTNSITFSPAGDATGDVANGAELFRLCNPDKDDTTARVIHMNGVGRAWVNRTVGIFGLMNSCP